MSIAERTAQQDDWWEKGGQQVRVWSAPVANVALPPLPTYGPGSLAALSRRATARLLDGLFLVPWLLAVLVATTWVGHPFGPAGVFHGAHFVEWWEVTGGFWLAGFVAYETAFTCVLGRTPGKALIRIRPVRPHRPHEALSLGRSLARSFTYFMWTLVPFAGALLALFDLLSSGRTIRRQCWHDLLCDTVVISDT